MRNRNIIFTMIPFLFGYVALASTARGVLPAPVPDGGYLNGNTAEGGPTTLHNLTSGHFNTAVGYYSLNSDTTGGRNTATGTNALRYNTTGSFNTATGTNALFSNTGSYNTAIGDSALAGLAGFATGWYNVAVGANALLYYAGGSRNTATGTNALRGNPMRGSNNTAIGTDTLYTTAAVLITPPSATARSYLISMADATQRLVPKHLLITSSAATAQRSGMPPSPATTPVTTARLWVP